MDFVQYLKETSSEKVGKQPLFMPGIYDEGSATTWKPLNESEIVSLDAITEAENRLGCTLPAGYRAFMETLGPGIWADAGIPHPDSLYAFEEEVGEMCGFIPLGYNVDGCGNYAAFNPAGDNSDLIYFCCHDPFGFVVASNSFEEWIQTIATKKLNDPKHGLGSFYDSLCSFQEISPPKVNTGRSWWQFWK